MYEINAWVWLNELSRDYGRFLTLDSIPERHWDEFADLGIDALWLMGVWKRSPEGIRCIMMNNKIQMDLKQALPDYKPEDNIGSPYCVRNYRVDRRFGGCEGLTAARIKLAERGIRLILDLVPNHVAPDHPWVTEHPEYFIQGDENDLRNDPESFFATDKHIFARGRDPHYPAWPDVLQLNAYDPGMRHAMTGVLSEIAEQCDGLRCDMAMLTMNPVFERTWGIRAGQSPSQEYWPELIQSVRHQSPDFLFIAEAYWDVEWELQQQGFDYCYDKRLYDRLIHGNAENVRLHLRAERAFQDKLVRFIENHDEWRAAAAFSLPQHYAAAVTMATIPGLRLFHEGQFAGRTVCLPVFLGRRPMEPEHPDIQAFYSKLLEILNHDSLKNGEWQLCERTGWPGNFSHEGLVAWCWKNDQGKYLITVNLSHTDVQAQVQLPWNDMAGKSWILKDLFTGASYKADGDNIRQPGLHVDLPPWGFHIFSIVQAEDERP